MHSLDIRALKSAVSTVAEALLNAARLADRTWRDRLAEPLSELAR